MWVAAVEKAGTTDPSEVADALGGMTAVGLTGMKVLMDLENHHLHKPAFVGAIKSDGSIDTVWSSDGLVEPKPWSPYMNN